MDLLTLAQKLVAIGNAEGGKMFFGKPDRWHDKPGPRLRCINGHVSDHFIRSESRGGDCCPECMEYVLLTFPEDENGELFI